MSHEHNITAVKEIYDAVARGDVDAILDRVTDDVDWAAEAASSAAPWYGQRSGNGGAGSFYGDLASSIEITQFTPHSHASSDDRVHLLVDWAFRSIATGRETSMTMHHDGRLRDGKVAHFRGSEDAELTAQVFTA